MQNGWLKCRNIIISNNPQFIVRGFIKSGITDAIDGITSTENSEELEEALNSEEEYTDEESDGGEESDNEGSESEEEVITNSHSQHVNHSYSMSITTTTFTSQPTCHFLTYHHYIQFIANMSIIHSLILSMSCTYHH